MKTSRSIIVLLFALFLAPACRPRKLESATGSLQLSPATQSFPSVYPGQRSDVRVNLSNSGQAPVAVQWSSPAAPFSSDALPQTVNPGTIALQLHFAPQDAGTYQASLTATAPGQVVQAAVTAQALPIPACPTPVTCHQASFDLTTSACVESALPDGTTCDPHDACLVDPVCRSGRCVGTPKVCDDGNACTLDSCDAIAGCQALPIQCPGDGACQVGVCDPKNGCGLAAAADGTVCGPSTCSVAKVCITGQCVSRVPPDGFLCSPATPCQGEGRCLQSQVGSSRVDLQACKLEYSIVSPK